MKRCNGGERVPRMLRKDFIAASALATASPSLATFRAASTPSNARADFDAAAFAAAVGRPAAIREVVEAVGFHPAVLNNVKNALNGLQFGFGYAPAIDRHRVGRSRAFVGLRLRRRNVGEIPPRRVLAYRRCDAARRSRTTRSTRRTRRFDRNADPDDPKGMYQDASVEMLQRRGVIVLTCHTAVMEQARASGRRRLRTHRCSYRARRRRGYSHAFGAWRNRRTLDGRRDRGAANAVPVRVSDDRSMKARVAAHYRASRCSY